MKQSVVNLNNLLFSLLVVPIGIELQTRLLSLDAQYVYGIPTVFALFLQDLLLVGITYYVVRRCFKQQLSLGAEHFHTILAAERINLAASFPVNDKDLLASLWSNMNTLLAKSERTITQIIASVARLIPMSQELKDGTLQCHYSKSRYADRI